jgi:hypothetical protein
MSDQDKSIEASKVIEEVYEQETDRDSATLPVFYNPQFDLIEKAKAAIPSKPLSQDSTEVEPFEVVVALNLDPPYRYSQEYFWLEVLAKTKKEAVKTAFEWLREQPDTDGFEVTGFVRRSMVHETEIGLESKNLQVSWNLPIEKNTSPGTMIRHPGTGIRIGFVAGLNDEERVLPESFRGIYRLISRKPSPGADPVVLAPIVDLIDFRS